MPIVQREGADAPYFHGSGQLGEAMHASIAAMRSTAAQYRQLVDEARSRIANTKTSVCEVDALLHALRIDLDQ